MKYQDISFIDYNMDQLYLPLDLEIQIPEHHVCRIVHEAVEQINPKLLYKPFEGGGRPSYHPKMMLKVILYAYTQRIYSSRQMAKQLHENIYFMWLACHQKPDFRTINRFRSERMKTIIYETFFSIVDLLESKGMVKLEHYFLDGTKLEANANRYTFVWRKSTERYDRNLDEKYQTILNGIEHVTETDVAQEDEPDMEERLERHPVSSTQIQETIKTMEKRLEAEPKNRELKKAKRQLEKDLLPRKQKYEVQKETFQGRNSYAKTDPDATFMRMKDDHMRNGQLKPGYNVQIGTENQFITSFSLHQRAGDPGCLIPHLNLLASYGRPKPEALIADSGYGSEENYAFCEKEEIEAFVKYNTLDKENTKRWKSQVGRHENMTYDEELDEWECANGKRLTFINERKRKSENGYQSVKRAYRCTACQGCPFQETCAKGKDTKTIVVSMENRQQRQEVKARLATEAGEILYRQRKCDVEPVFGHIKSNRDFDRFTLRGLPKVTVEWGLLCVAHNFLKWATLRKPTDHMASKAKEKVA